MDNHLFDSFNELTDERWKNQVSKDLKGRTAEDIQASFPYEDIHLSAYFTSAPNLEVPQTSSPGWKVVAKSEEWAADTWKNKADNQNGYDLFRLKAEHLPAPSLPDGSGCMVLIENWKAEFLRHIETLPVQGDRFIQYDPISQALQSGNWQQSEKTDLSHLHSICEWQALQPKNYNWLFVDGTVYSEAGASATQELSLSLSHLNTYLDSLRSEGLLGQCRSEAITVNLGIGSNYLLEIAKFRAARIVFTQLLEAYKLPKPEFWNLGGESSTIHFSTSDTDSNILRNTMAGMAAATGGCQHILLHPHASDKPSFSSRITRNIQLIMRNEAHLDKVQDPASGSYFIEHLTKALAEKAWAMFQQNESQGGLIHLLESNRVQDDIAVTATMRIKRFRDENDTVIGVNKYQKQKRDSLPKATDPIDEAGAFRLLSPLRLENYI